jgi:hypothetical protein
MHINEKTLKKRKDIFLYDLNGNKYYDFSTPLNIIGFSNKRLTHYIKNHISGTLRLTGSTIYHRRLKALFKELFGDEYELYAALSLEEIFLKMEALFLNEFAIEPVGERFKEWYPNRVPSGEKNGKAKKIKTYDMTELYLNAGSDRTKAFENVNKNDSVKILNYFWYPEIELNTLDADLVILPELYSGNFSYLNILLRKTSKLYDKAKRALTEIEEIPSLYIASSLKYYYLIKEEKNIAMPVKLEVENILQTGRLFSFKEFDKEKIIDKSKIFYDNKIVINTNAPFYSYLPLRLEDYQKKYLKRVKK